MHQAAADIDDKPPYMRGSDAERRHPPEEDLRRIGDEFGDMQSDRNWVRGRKGYVLP